MGTIDNLVINIHKGEIEYVLIEFGSFLGLGGKLFAVPFSDLKPKPGKHTFIYNRDKKYLKQSPGLGRIYKNLSKYD